ncbi:unnamed protein product [Callosobruchus maculatus]|uniref:Uncharacterized protein n=1 Tax=Callosobruchus maculatus TaxID=64391 RepID=A0A653DU20_CALMS|nr:unnamed protein product [Callosobruchus maculatus]
MADHILRILEVLLEDDTAPDEPNVAGVLGGLLGHLVGGSAGYVQGAAIGNILHRVSTSGSNLGEKIHNLSMSQKEEIIKLVLNVLRRASVPESVLCVAYLASHPNLREAILKDVKTYLKNA